MQPWIEFAAGSSVVRNPVAAPSRLTPPTGGHG